MSISSSLALGVLREGGSQADGKQSVGLKYLAYTLPSAQNAHIHSKDLHPFAASSHCVSDCNIRPLTQPPFHLYTARRDEPPFFPLFLLTISVRRYFMSHPRSKILVFGGVPNSCHKNLVSFFPLTSLLSFFSPPLFLLYHLSPIGLQYF